MNPNDLLMEIIQNNNNSTNDLESILKLKEFCRLNSIFSLNEELDDLPTEYLKFLLLDYLQGKLLEEGNIITTTTAQRLNVVKDAIKYYNDFIELVTLYGFPTAAAAVNSAESITGVMIGREEKIRQLKEMKELRSHLELLLSTTSSNAIMKEEEEEEDSKREYWIKYIQFCIKQVQQERMRMLTQELNLLENVLKDNVNPTNITTNTKTASFKPFVLLPNKRVELQERVFKPSHRLPTMTIDEYLQKEYERGGVISSSKDVAVKKKDESDSEEEDIVKKRQWDEFKDDNKRGWGNRMNKG
jgi:hypothetical protein